MAVIDDELLVAHIGGKHVLAGDLSTIPSSNETFKITKVLLQASCFPDVASHTILHLLEYMSPLDWVPFLSQPWHREHQFHQIRVAIVANWLFDYLQTDLQEYVTYPNQQVEAALWTASVLHDHGYALARLARLYPILAAGAENGLSPHGQDMLQHLLACYRGLFAGTLLDYVCVPRNSDEPIEVLKARVDDLVRQSIRTYLGTKWIGLDEDILQRLAGGDLYSHGLWSAMNFSATLNKLGMPWSRLQCEDRLEPLRTAIYAMAIHDREDFIQADFDIPKNPIAGILLLADELQEWDRVAVPSSDPEYVRCRIDVEQTSAQDLSVHFTYSTEDLKTVRSSTSAVEAWKKSAIEQRINGAQGFPEISVTVSEAPAFTIQEDI